MSDENDVDMPATMKCVDCCQRVSEELVSPCSACGEAGICWDCAQPNKGRCATCVDEGRGE